MKIFNINDNIIYYSEFYLSVVLLSFFTWPKYICKSEFVQK